MFLSWTDALARVAGELSTHPGAWQTTIYRLLVLQQEGKKNKWVDAVVAHFQTSPSEAASSVELVEEEPTVLHGIMHNSQFLSALDSWSRDEPFELDGWSVWPPAMRNVQLYWHSYLSEGDLLHPLFVSVRRGASQYAVHWLSGSGVNPVNEQVRDQLFRAAQAQQITPQRWTTDYLGLPWSSHIPIPQLHVYMPIPVVVDGSYDSRSSQLVVSVHYHGFSISDFWLRIGPSWSAAIPSDVFKEETPEPDGWRGARLRKQIQLDQETVAWVGLRRSPNHFRWRAPIPVTLEPAMPIPPEQFRKWCDQFIDEVYRRAGPSTNQPVDVFKVADYLDILHRDALNVMQYLVDGGLLKEYQPGTGQVVLTQQGLREIIEAKKNPEKPTEHLGPINVSIGNVSNAQIAIASPGAQQHLVINLEERKEIMTWVDQANQRVPEIGIQGDDLAELKAQLATISAQLASPRPQRSVIRTAIRTIVDTMNAAASLATLAPAASGAIDFLVHNAPHLSG